MTQLPSSDPSRLLPRPPATFTVLVADDDPDTVEVMAFLLERDGYQVLKAYNGYETMHMVDTWRPDLVLLDVRMPGADGYAVCRHIKANPQTAFIPVVMITHVRGLDNRITGVDAGADDFLNKPVNEVELAARVRSLLRMKGLHDELEVHRRNLEATVQERTAQLQAALTRLQSLDRLKADIVNNVSHELRTPLTQVKNAVDLIEGCASPDEMSALVSVAKQASARLERLVRSIVELESGLNVTKEPTSVTDSIHRAIVALHASQQAHSVHIEADIEKGLPPVLADRVGLVRALQHLLDNAIKFSPDGATVEIIARRAEGGVWIGVRDHGIGIPGDAREHIFEEFYQVDGSATRPFGGMGIGLSIVKLIIEGHGAKVNVESAQGKGSTFSFVLAAAG